MSANFRFRPLLALAVLGVLGGASFAPAFAGGSPAAQYFTVDPCRVLDTRPGDLTSGVAEAVQFKGVCNVPTEASAVAISITAINPTGNGHLTFYPTGTPVPEVSYLNFSTGKTRSGSVIVLLSTSGLVDVLPFVSGSGSVELVIDVFGYFVENISPVADDDSYGPVDEGGTLNVPAATGVLDGDTDADGDPLTAVLVTGPAHASSFTLNLDGSFSYTHDGSETTTDSFTYTANDGTGSSNVATVTISITPVNDAPLADDDGPYTVTEGGTLNEPAATGVLNGDTDAEGTSLTAVLDAGPAHASSFTLNPDGSFSYTHDGSETTTDSFTYHASDGSLSSNVATVSITITPQNDAPVADDDGPYSVAEGGTLNEPAASGVLVGDTDAEGSTLTAVLDAGPAHASSFTLNPDGSFTYVHDGGESTTDSFTYHAFDGTASSNVATATITITPVNDAPVADNDGPYTVNEGGPLSVPAATGVLIGDTDAEGSTLTAVLDAGPAHASSFTLNPDGSFSYTHDGSETTTDSFTYHAFDGALSSNVATVTITITPVNDPPVADDDAYGVNEGATLSVPAATGVLFGDTDPEGTALTAVLDAGPTHASSFTLNADGSFSYTHDGGETTTDSFTYHAFDGLLGSNVATVTITITPQNDAPVLDLDADDSGGTTGANYAITFADGDAAKFIEDPADATITDADSANLATLTVTLTNLLDPTFEVLDVDLVGANPAFSKTYDTTTDPAKGVLTITASPVRPVAEFNALLRKVTYVNTDDDLTTTARIVEFVANDGTGNSNTATTTVTVTAVNDPPTADNDGPYSVNEGGTLSVPAATGVLNGDTDPEGATLTAVLDSGPAHASSFTLNPDGSFSYTHDGGETTTDSFTYHAFDGSLSSNVATVSITITPVNDPPTADNDGPYSVNEGATLSVPAATGVLNGDTDPEGTTLTAVLDSGPAHASSFTLNADGSFSYTHDGSETPLTDSFTYHAFDGSASSNIATVSITITPVNDPPTADNDGPYSVDEGAALTVPAATGVLNGDTDPDSGSLTAVLNVGPAHASSFTLNADGSFSYTHDGSETTTDSFTYHAFDGAANSNVATVTITVNPVNDAPTADNDGPYSVNEGATLTVPAATGVLNGDNDVDSGSLTAVLNVGPAHASSFSLNADGSFSYTHDGSETTSDSFTYHAFDGALSSNVATVTITINPVNDPPVANADTADITEEAPNVVAINTVSGNVLTNDVDPDSTLSVSAVAGGTVGSPKAGTYGSVTINSNGSFTYTLDDTNPLVNALAPGQTLLDGFGYTASDGALTSSSTLTVTIHGADDPPTPDNDAWDFIGNVQIEVDRDTAGTPEVLATTPAVPTELGVLDGDVDPDGGPAITISGIVGCADVTAPFDCPLAGQGIVSLQADGSLSFIPEPGDTDATATFQYTLTGNPNPATVTFTRFERVWFVDPGAGAGNGTSATPFNSLDSLDGGADSDVAGDYIFVHDGTLALSGPMPMENNQRLIGEGHVAVTTPSNFALSIPVGLNGNASPTNLVPTGTRPQLTNANGDTIRVTTEIPIEIVGLSLAGGNVGCGGAGPTSCNAIDLTTAAALTGSSTLAIRNNEFRGAGTPAQTNGEGIDVNLNASTTGTLTLNVTNNTWNAGGTHVGNAVDVNRAAGTLRLNFSDNTGVVSSATAVNINGGAAASTTITGFANNTVHQNTVGNGIVIQNVNFDSDTAAANLQTVSGGSSVIGVSGDGVGGAGLTITTSNGDLSFTDLDVYTSAGAGIAVTGTGSFTGSAGTSLRVGAGVGNVASTGGPAVDLNNLTADLQFTSVTSTNTGTTGVSLTSVSDGSSANAVFSAGSGSSITTTAGASGPAFNVSGGNAKITYAGTITNNSTTARAVSVSTWAGDDAGDDLLFSGAIDENGAGILLNGNSGSRAITFSGGMDIDTTSGEGFAATSNTNTLGLHVTGTNTIDSISATGLRVTNTVIGNSDLTFQRISSGNNTAAADPANGIVLTSTGTLGGLKVTGTGASGLGGNGTGGTIQNTTGHGIAMTSTAEPSFENMSIQGALGSGVNGTQVTDFTFDNGTINNSGTGGAAEDSNITFNDSLTNANVSGTLTVTDSILTNSRNHGVDIQNPTGTVSNANISGNTFTSSTSVASSLGSAIRIIALGSSTAVGNVTRATLANNVITNFPSGAGFVIQGGNSQDDAGAPAGILGVAGSGSDVIAITGNRMDGGSGGVGNQPDRFVTAAINGRGQGNINISNNGTVGNPITHIDGVVVEVSAFGATTLTTTVSGNVIASNNAVGSAGIGIGCDADSLGTTTDNATLTSTISGNTISLNDGPDIYALARNSSCTHTTKILNNSAAAPNTTTAARAGIRVDSGSASGNATVCLEISGNTTFGSTNTATSTTSPGINLRKQGTVATTNTFGIEGLSPSPTGTPNVENHVNGMNTSSSGTFGVGGTALLSGTSGFVSCVAP